MYDRDTLLYSRHWHIIINQLKFKKFLNKVQKQKEDK